MSLWGEEGWGVGCMDVLREHMQAQPRAGML
jgi:hypothetical protein